MLLQTVMHVDEIWWEIETEMISATMDWHLATNLQNFQIIMYLRYFCIVIFQKEKSFKLFLLALWFLGTLVI
jgi:hypothetical protein